MQTLFQSLAVLPTAWRVPFLLAALALGLFAGGATWSRLRLWGLARPSPYGPLGQASFGRMLWLSARQFFSADCLLARRVAARSRWRALMVMAFVWSSLALAGGVLVSLLGFALNQPLPAVVERWAAPVLDVAGLALLAGLLAALLRRYLFPPARWIWVSADGALLVLFILPVLTGFLLEGTRLAGTGWQAAGRWPVGAALGLALAWLPLSTAAWQRVYLGLYLAHAGSALLLLAYLPFSKLFHIFASQVTTFAARQRVARLAGRPGKAAREGRA